MSDAIGPGDWVECVNNGERGGRSWFRPELNVGAIYLVDQVSAADWLTFPGPCVWLRGQTNPAPLSHGAYHADRFRPIRSDITSIERLLTEPIPADLIDA